MQRSISYLLPTLATLLLWSNLATAAPVVVGTQDGSVNPNSQLGVNIPFNPSATDLVNNGQPTFLSLTDTNLVPYLGGVSANLNNGVLGSPTTNAHITFDLDGSWSNTFNLNTTTNTLGYNITSISSYTGWTTGAYAQVYSLEYSLIGDPSFSLLTNVNYNPANIGGNNGTRVNITDSLGPNLLTGVDALRFNFTAGTAYREIDVFGFAVTEPQLAPEPASLVLMSLGLLTVGLIYWRRRASHVAIDTGAAR